MKCIGEKNMFKEVLTEVVIPVIVVSIMLVGLALL